MSLQTAIEKGLSSMGGFAHSVSPAQALTVATMALGALSAKSLFTSFFGASKSGATDDATECHHFEDAAPGMDPTMIMMASLAIAADSRKHEEDQRRRDRPVPALRPQFARTPRAANMAGQTPAMKARHLMMVA